MIKTFAMRFTQATALISRAGINAAGQTISRCNPMDGSSQQKSIQPKLSLLKSVLVLVILFAVPFTAPNTAFSQSGTVVAVEPPDLTLDPDQTIDVSVRVEGADAFYGLEITLRYDPSVIQIQDADPDQPGIQVRDGDLFEEDQGFLIRNQADNQQGELVYAFTLLAPVPPMSGSGTLIEFEVVGVGDGNSGLELEVILASEDGVALPVELQAGSVTVGTGPIITPTFTTTTRPPSPTGTKEIVNTSTAPAPSATSSQNDSPTEPLTGVQPTLTANPPPLTDATATIEANQNPEASLPPTSTAIEGEAMASPTNTDQTSGSQPETESVEAAGSRNPTLWVVGIVVLGIGGIVGGKYWYRRK
jgi:hypothetical protein